MPVSIQLIYLNIFKFTFSNGKTNASRVYSFEPLIPFSNLLLMLTLFNDLS